MFKGLKEKMEIEKSLSIKIDKLFRSHINKLERKLLKVIKDSRDEKIEINDAPLAYPIETHLIQISRLLERTYNMLHTDSEEINRINQGAIIKSMCAQAALQNIKKKTDALWEETIISEVEYK